jgi:hypothetical protein
VIGGNSYQLNIGAGAMITNSSLNVGEGTQIVVDAAGSKGDVLTGVEALVRAGLTGVWSADAAHALQELLDGRGDVTRVDVQKVTTEVVLAEQPNQGRARGFLEQVAADGLGARLERVITGLAEVLSQLPI